MPRGVAVYRMCIQSCYVLHVGFLSFLNDLNEAKRLNVWNDWNEPVYVRARINFGRQQTTTHVQ